MIYHLQEVNRLSPPHEQSQSLFNLLQRQRSGFLIIMFVHKNARKVISMNNCNMSIHHSFENCKGSLPKVKRNVPSQRYMASPSRNVMHLPYGLAGKPMQKHAKKMTELRKKNLTSKGMSDPRACARRPDNGKNSSSTQ
ncbi:MAG: hypothetical protein PHW10_03285 [Candidatus Peribacteraceae bacterium]|nr:hypothetical protein [Candidatus Peribacteraceae bacterium]